jgi:hypothetical protein
MFGLLIDPEQVRKYTYVDLVLLRAGAPEMIKKPSAALHNAYVHRVLGYLLRA